MHSLKEKASQIVFPRWGSNMVPPIRARDDVDRLKNLLTEFPFGGLVLFNGDTDSTPHDLASLQRLAPKPLIVGSDIERGTGQQIAGATTLPHAMALGKAGLEATRKAARITAREALLHGIHVAFAPVADVNTDPKNPIIGIRAFGSHPREVADHVRAYIEACQHEGLLATAKHFPGHGNTHTDSHADLPIVEASLNELQQVDLAPFHAAIQAGVACIMTAHVAYPALDSTQAPATASRPILTGLLRDQMHFGGPVITDSLIMEGIRKQGASMEELATQLLQAGITVFLDPVDPVGMVEGIIYAVEKGNVPPSTLDSAIERLDRIRTTFMQRFGIQFFTDPQTALSTLQVDFERHQETAQELAFEGIVSSAERSASSFPPETVVLMVMPYKTHLDPPLQPLGVHIGSLRPDIRYYEVEEQSPASLLSQIQADCTQAPHVIACAVAKPAAWRAHGLPASLHDFLQSIVSHNKTTLIALGEPGILEHFPAAYSRVSTHSDSSASQLALTRWLNLDSA